ncbi:hypothetical protein CAQU_09875 [Corynebacterium aquilae DSM 44791]|uniref:Phage head-tail adapter protein n=1 Tax=Corynebacterium aquilae DSM 44791 TaxID=1431546 RepID=A0A1L7CHJ8_9CORY|nr:hypothetical protein CAQU_09875 [Corynebacterium aquilae DSM 44791]
MSAPRIIFNQRLEIVKPREVRSRYSTETKVSWDQPTYEPVDFLVSVQPSSSSEGPVERPQASQTLQLFTPPGTDIPELSEASRVRIGGVLVCAVLGPPARWPDPWKDGQVHHLEAQLGVIHG